MARKKQVGEQQKTQKNQGVPNLSEDQAREHIEKIRWPNGPFCPHCASVNVYRMEGQSIRAGLLACRDCRGHFTVTVGTVMEDSHLPLSTWVRAFHFMATSKKGMSALQLQRNLGLVAYRTVWHLAQRIREAMRCEPVVAALKGTVEVDETYVGPKSNRRGRTAPRKKCIVALIERDGKAVATIPQNLGGKTLRQVVRDHVDPSAVVNTDGFGSYKGLANEFAGHDVVNHIAGEYARGDAYVNTCESFFGLLKRGINGTFHHISAEHAHRYADEFAFRWNSRKSKDVVRRDLAVAGAEGKRLFLYKPVGQA